MSYAELQPTTQGRASDTIGYPEAAELLHVAPGTLYAWVHQKRIPHFRLSGRCVRFSRADLLAWMAGHAVSPPKAVAQ
jgi:excisionase family DNA binding protein